MMMVAISVAAITTFVYFTLFARVSKHAVYLAAGHSFWVDLLFTGVISLFAAATGSLTALIISALTGLFISLTLFAIKWYIGSAKITRTVNTVTGKKSYKFGIQYYPPTKQLPTVLEKIKQRFVTQQAIA